MSNIERIQKVIDNHFSEMIDYEQTKVPSTFWVTPPDNEDLIRFAVEILQEFEKCNP